MKNPLISVVVPVYKVERYLPRCIESILGQTYTNIELILVDDGSPDNSGKICDEYALKDSRIRVVHKENGGVSSARNIGIDLANGEYINFIDSDDWVPKNSLEILLNAISESDADLSIGGYESRGVKIAFHNLESKFIDFKWIDDDELVNIFQQPFLYSVWCKLFKIKILNDKDIRFSKETKIGEDTLFVRNYLKYISNIVISNNNVYFYNQLNLSSATKKYYPKLVDWSAILVSEFSALLDKHIEDNQLKYQSISEHAFGRFNYTSLLICKNLDKQDALKQLSHVYEGLNTYLSLNDEWTYVHDNLFDLRKLVSKRNIELIYNYYISRIRENKLKRIKQIAFKMIAPHVERKRDGLIKIRLK